MKRCQGWLAVLTITALLAIAGTTSADDEKGTPLSQEMQDKLLEKFRDQGIDANGDGILTREEKHAFFANKKHGSKEKMKGKGKYGHGKAKGADHARGHKVAWKLEFLEMLEAETAPATFSPTVFPESDANSDGQISAEEWQAFAQKHRERILAHLAKYNCGIDANGDGTIDAEEIEAFKTVHVAQMRRQALQMNPDADTDGNGALSDEEFEAFRASHMEKYRTQVLEHYPKADVDGNGALSDGELYAFKLKKGHDYGGEKKGKKDWHGKKDKGSCGKKKDKEEDHE